MAPPFVVEWTFVAYKTRATFFLQGLSIAPCQEAPKEMNAAGQTCTNDRRKRFAEGRRTTAPMAIVTRGKTLSLATKNAPNLEADPGTRAPSKSSPGVSSLFVIVWQRLWIIGAHNLIRRITHDCLSCFLQCYHTAQQQMVDLPIVRVTQALPFVNTGCDYAGPIFLKDAKVRKPHISKGYICLFVCMVTSAIHLELATDSTLVYDEIQWVLIPPRDPHWGGKWESAVRCIKLYLRQVTGNSMLTFEQMRTLPAYITAVISSRPL